jgi:hypothetical protein
MQVLHKQNLFDIAIQEDGSIFAAFDWALKNGISLTDDLTPGQILITPESNFRNTDIVNYFKYRKQNIGTALEPVAPNKNIYEFPGGDFPISF